MCGIVGVARRSDRRPIDAAEVRVMCDAIRHRGPDDEGMHVHGQAGIGMRRLSIIDLAGGHQPIYNEDRTKVVVLNGEIYNYRELRHHLAERGHRFRTNSDTETIVHLYEDYGADCVKHLRGMFAFALWDETERRLLLARDRFGMKPLYIAATDDQIAFGSELKALRAAGFAGNRLDWAAMDAFFALGYVPAPFSPFEDVRKLEPGHLLDWRDGEWTERQYWDLPQETRAAGPDVVTEVTAALDESVAAHLVSDVPLAVLLSGGLDSSAVFSSMAIAGATPHAYTARYRGTGAQAADESGLASALAQRYGARLTVVDIEPRVADLLEPIMFALDEPHADESAVPTWLLSQRVAQDYKVVLGGTGGDELFAGYRRHRGLLMSERYTRLPAALRALFAGALSMVPEPRGGGLGVHRLKRFARTAPGSVPARYFDMLNKVPDLRGRSLFTRDASHAATAGTATALLERLYRQGGSPAGVRAALYLDYKTYLPDDILHLGDRISMAHSLEMRTPFVDHRLVERVYPLPDSAKLGPSGTKHLLRQVLAKRLPAEHFSAPKRGFVGPTASWLRNELRETVQDELSHDRMKRLGFFDPAVVDGLVKDHMSRRHNREAVLWALLSFSVWHRVHCEAAPAVAAPAVAS